MIMINTVTMPDKSVVTLDALRARIAVAKSNMAAVEELIHTEEGKHSDYIAGEWDDCQEELQQLRAALNSALRENVARVFGREIAASLR